MGTSQESPWMTAAATGQTGGGPASGTKQLGVATAGQVQMPSMHVQSAVPRVSHSSVVSTHTCPALAQATPGATAEGDGQGGPPPPTSPTRPPQAMAASTGITA